MCGAQTRAQAGPASLLLYPSEYRWKTWGPSLSKPLGRSAQYWLPELLGSQRYANEWFL